MKGDGVVKKSKLIDFVFKGKLPIDIMILAVITVLCYITPFASYTYKRVEYTISGFEFLFGKTIMGGKLVISPSWAMIAELIVIIVLVVVALIFSKLKPRWGGLSILAIGVVFIVITMVFTSAIPDILVKAKNVKVSYGSILFMVIGIAIIARGFHILYQAKAVTALDFMVLPGLLYIIINNYLPMFGILLAFKKIDFSVGIWKSGWIGFENFKYLFATNDTFIITRNTILYNLAFIIVGNTLGIIVGICLSEVFSKKLQKLFQTTILLPQLISMIIVAYIVYGFLSNEAGWINNTILGKDNAINFYATKSYWPFILLFVNTWKGLGYSSIIFMSSIIGIDKSLYEASYVDGCGRWKQIVNITLPLLKPTIITLVLIQVGRIFYSDFGLFYQVPMDSGSLYSVTQTIDTYVYRGLMKNNNISMASAASAYQSVIGFTIIMIVNRIVSKVDKDSALF